MKDEKKIASGYDVIIVNYNGEKIISRCLDSVNQSTKKPVKIIIYDNNSSDQSVSLIRKKYPEVDLIEGGENLGFGRANNKAMERSQQEFILFLNNDVLLDKKCAEKLIERFTDDNLAVVNPLIFKGWEKKPGQEIYAFGAEMNEGGFNYGLYDQGKDRLDLNSFSGACVMVKSHEIKKIKFEKRFFMYGEEAEISSQLLKRGKKIGRTGVAVCYHLESYSSPQKNRDGLSFRQFQAIPNRWYTVGKNWPVGLLPKALVLNLIHLSYISFFFILNRKFSYLKVLFIAPCSFISGLLDRKNSKTVDERWHRHISKMQLYRYFTLGKRVFSKRS